MKYTITLLILLLGTAVADSSTVFETQFATLPDGWYNNEWHFNAQLGAWLDEWVTSAEPPFSFTAEMGTQVQWYFVPDGTDSLLVHIEHDLYFITFGSEDIYIALNYLSGESLTLFSAEELTGPSTSDPIDVVIVSPPADTWIGFTIHAHVSASYPGYATIEWFITELSVTAYGTELELGSTTWGGIKTALCL